MLRVLGVPTLDELVGEAVPPAIRFAGTLDLPAPANEAEVLSELRALAAKNQIWKSFIGMGYSDCITPPAIQRNILENPGWYTPYTPYQAEIAQGRLESLLNFQTMVADLTGMEVANASLLDEATAAAEAMTLLHRVHPPSPKASASAKAPADKTVGKKAGPYDAGAVRRRSFRCWMQCSSKCATPSTVIVMREPS